MITRKRRRTPRRKAVSWRRLKRKGQRGRLKARLVKTGCRDMSICLR